MTQSPELGHWAAAMAAAQAAIVDPKKSIAVKVPLKSGGSYEYRYADLASVFQAIRQPFAANGLALTQDVAYQGQCVTVETTIVHTSGQWVCGRLDWPCRTDDIKALGSAITYLRRYSLSALCGLTSEQDDDGLFPSPRGFPSPQVGADSKDNGRRRPASTEQDRSPEAAERKRLARDFHTLADRFGIDERLRHHWAHMHFDWPVDEQRGRASAKTAPMPGLREAVAQLRRLKPEGVAQLVAETLDDLRTSG